MDVVLLPVGAVLQDGRIRLISRVEIVDVGRLLKFLVALALHVLASRRLLLVDGRRGLELVVELDARFDDHYGRPLVEAIGVEVTLALRVLAALGQSEGGMITLIIEILVILLRLVPE